MEMYLYVKTSVVTAVTALFIKTIPMAVWQ